MTAEELLNLPRGKVRHELVSGNLITFPLAGCLHGMIAADIGSRLHAFVHAHRLGQTFAAGTGFILNRNPDTVLAPDASYLSHERMRKHDRPTRGYFPSAPDLVVEVNSPEDNQVGIGDRVAEWLKGGALLVWWVEPDRKTITTYNSLCHVQPQNVDAILLGDPVLPGFSVALTDIFPDE